MNIEDEIPPFPIHEDYVEMYSYLRQRLSLHRSSAVKRNRRYQRLATGFNFALPILAVALTVEISLPGHWQWVMIVTAVVLTFTSTVNAVFNPTDRYR